MTRTLPRPVLEYLQKCGSGTASPLCSGSDSLRDIHQVVVIPALAEKRYLFSTLASLARNAPEELERTLVICVINNRPCPSVSREMLQNNLETIEILHDLLAGRMPSAAEEMAPFSGEFRQILQGGLRLAYLDASSAGREMPVKKGGAGLARKLGLDAALSVMDYCSPGAGRLLCLDADSPVEINYFSAVRRFYESRNAAVAVVAYAHPFPEDPRLLAAICSYEIFLRYYVLGLSYSESPYAFHSIGSTMTCTVQGYVAVRGMNRREAGEDFYFLNKLAKLFPVGKIADTRVYPSPRSSQRAPFGTGQRMRSSLEGTNREDTFYDPQVFHILKSWLKGMKDSIGEGGDAVLKMAVDISPHLASFLEKNDFPLAWERIGKTHRSPEKRAQHFQEWFDAFRTMKLIHYLTEAAYPAGTLGHVLPELLEWMGQPLWIPIREFRSGNVPGLEEQIEILKNLRDSEFKKDD